MCPLRKTGERAGADGRAGLADLARRRLGFGVGRRSEAPRNGRANGAARKIAGREAHRSAESQSLARLWF